MIIKNHNGEKYNFVFHCNMYYKGATIPNITLPDRIYSFVTSNFLMYSTFGYNLVKESDMNGEVCYGQIPLLLYGSQNNIVKLKLML